MSGVSTMAKKQKRKSKTKVQMRREIVECFMKHLGTVKCSGYAVQVLANGDAGWERPGHDSFAVRVNSPYKTVSLFIGDDIFSEYNPAWNDKHLLHEAVHVMLWDFSLLAESRYVTKEQLSDMDETLTDHITNVLYFILNDKA